MKLAYYLNLKPTSTQVILVASLCIATILNLPFLSSVYQIVSPDSPQKWGFFLSVPLLLTLLSIIFLSLFGGLLFPRLTVAVTLTTSFLLFYSTLEYGVVFDKDMIQNILETNSGEALSYLNPIFIIFMSFGLLSIYLLVRQRVGEKFGTRLKQLAVLNGLAIVGIMLIATVLYKNYAAVGRNNKELTNYIIPYTFFTSAFKSLRDNFFYPPLPYKILDEHPMLKPVIDDSPSTTVVVVGETARADKFSSNGYTRKTTPYILQTNAVSFRDVTSCGTATAVSVPCMFSRLSRANYDSRVAESQDNVLDIIQRAGVEVTWIDNNSSCKGVCKRVDTINFDPARKADLCDGDYCYDEILLHLLKDSLSKSSKTHRLIVLHMIGSHGPTYFRRYPKTFSTFLPDCPRSDIQNCDHTELVNTYDNTILYTDYILGQIIALLDDVPNSSMLYISDHGESLGKKGLYLHGFPYKLAPEEQTHVPMIYWTSNLNRPDYNKCVNALSQEPFSHDNLYDTLLGLSHVQSVTYQANMDILSACVS